MTDNFLKIKECPTEHTLNAYITGALTAEKRGDLERHIADCPACIYRIAEAIEVVNEAGAAVRGVTMNKLKKINLWALSCVILFALSFVFPRYFIQFLTSAVIAAIKWIVDNRNTRTLIMIYDAWKKGGNTEAGRIIKSLENRMR